LQNQYIRHFVQNLKQNNQLGVFPIPIQQLIFNN